MASNFFDTDARGRKGVQIVPYAAQEHAAIPFFIARVPAGFPSPAADYLDDGLDLNNLVIRHPAATFFVRVEGESMLGAGIHPGDTLVVDRAEVPADRSVVVAVLNGEFTVKRISQEDGTLSLVSENERMPPIRLSEEMDFEVWGVVTYVIHQVQ
ncbi:MAG: LexA family protein [Candidatus Latescibacterota bacterium]